SGAQSVQPLVHCLGSMSFLMAMLSGAIEQAHVRSAICSQLTTHPRTNIENHIKSLIRLGNLLEDEKCHQPSCRRIYAFFGPSYKHSQLNDATHREIPRMFGTSSVKAFQHIGKIVDAGQIVDHNGADTYLRPENLARLAFPIMFLAGEDN